MKQALNGELAEAMGRSIMKSCERNEELGLKPCKAEIEVSIARGHVVPDKYLEKQTAEFARAA
jgi:hypothetical protein